MMSSQRALERARHHGKTPGLVVAPCAVSQTLKRLPSSFNYRGALVPELETPS